MILAAGDKLGPYEIVAPLGAGGMGQVYRARDTRLGRDVAVKLVAESLTRDPSAVDRFVREAHAASRLNHPGIVTIHEIGEDERGRFIVMELVQGKTLRKLAAVAWESVVDLGRQIAKALAAAHAEGIVHRDVKPENVMVRDDGFVKLLDFGLARLIPTEAASSEVETASGTKAGTVLGTIRYMAPEQARGERVDGAADIFALGLVLYELATGRHPFAAEGPFGVLDAIAREPAFPPSRLNPEIPEPLEVVLLRMLEKDPRRRPTAIEVDALLAQVAGTSPPPGATRASSPRRRGVGREEERAALRAAFETAATGSGLLVCVAGEPGIGKSTLVEDFLAELSADSLVCVARGRCSERLAGTEACLPWLEALEDLARGASGVEKARLLRFLAPSWYAQVAPSDAEFNGKMSDPRPASQERIKRELAAFLQEAGRARSLVLFFDDVHWSDASTVDLLTYVGTRLTSMRLLVVATYRPSELALSRHPFGSVKLDLQSRGLCREISLGFLSPGEVGDYLAVEFPGHQFPADFAAFIHEKTEGSPLFMSGLLHDLRERGILAPESGHFRLVSTLPAIEKDIPESVRSMIERKIAKLLESDGRLLAAASVQGYEFDSAIVAQALGRDPAEVEEQLGVLDRVHAFVARLRESELPDRTVTVRYRFVHLLYQNALYGSITLTRRIALSGAIANALVAHSAEAGAEIASELALLLEAAREPERAIDYFVLAARRAAMLFAHQEVAVLSRRALALLPLLPETPERDRRELDLLVALGPALGLTRGYSAAAVEEVLQRARELCRRMEDPTRLFPVLYGLCVLHAVRAESRVARDLSSQLDSLAEAANDPHLRLQSRHAIWPALVAEGELLEARASLEDGLMIYDRDEHSSLAHSFGGHDPGVCGLAFHGLALWALGYPDRALVEAREALALARALSHPVSIGQAQCYTAMLHQLRREASAAREHARESVIVTRDRGVPQFLSYGNVLHGWAQAELEDPEAGLAEIREGLDAANAMENRFLLPHWFSLLADALRNQGRADEGLAAVDEGIREVRRCGQSYSESELHRIKGELFLLRGDEAEVSLREAVDTARRQSARSFELRAAVSLARLLHSRGRNDEARPALQEIYEWFTEGFDTADLLEARALLAKL